jgi:NAD(P)-dependent dehydrogenase (short-subunit alcohol dehydrogenase family)
MPRVLVTGAGRGIGLEFARQYRAADSGRFVDPAEAAIVG